MEKLRAGIQWCLKSSINILRVFSSLLLSVFSCFVLELPFRSPSTVSWISLPDASCHLCQERDLPRDCQRWYIITINPRQLVLIRERRAEQTWKQQALNSNKQHEYHHGKSVHHTGLPVFLYFTVPVTSKLRAASSVFRLWCLNMLWSVCVCLIFFCLFQL